MPVGKKRRQRGSSEGRKRQQGKRRDERLQGREASMMADDKPSQVKDRGIDGEIMEE
ncbi:hypothetical protein HY310_03335 [Candidatus Microgenomates bacterium]|nr:hypothetical protein [Candidatus Microgenomates bacterium]